VGKIKNFFPVLPCGTHKYGFRPNTGHTQKNGAVLIVKTIKTAPFFCVCPVHPALIIDSAFVRYLKSESEFNEAVHHLSVHFKRVYVSDTREVLYNIVIGSGAPMKTAVVIEMCLNETCNKTLSGRYLEQIIFLSTLIVLIN
jgi:hypothetical protein